MNPFSSGYFFLFFFFFFLSSRRVTRHHPTRLNPLLKKASSFSPGIFIFSRTAPCGEGRSVPGREKRTPRRPLRGSFMSQPFFKSGPWEREKKLSSFINFSAELSRNLNINVTLWVAFFFVLFLLTKRNRGCEALEGLYLFLLN